MYRAVGLLHAASNKGTRSPKNNNIWSLLTGLCPAHPDSKSQNRVTGAISVAEDEQEDGVRGPCAPVRVGHIVRDIRRAAAVRPASGRRFPRVRRLQTGRQVGRHGHAAAGRGQQRIVRGLRLSQAAHKAARVRDD